MRIEELIKLRKDYGPVPFWFWNGDLKLEELEYQMQEMVNQNIYEFIIHARRGLTIEYLSDEWFNRVGFVLEKAKELGLKVWVYDEENWPSGYCGGRVIKENENFVAKNLLMTITTIEKLNDVENMICVLIRNNDEFTELENRSHYPLDQEVYVFIQKNTLWPAAYSDSYYVDLLNREVTNTFMRLTHYEYEKRFKNYFGNVIKGFFTDEPGFYNNLYMFGDRGDLNTVVWTDQFLNYFEEVNHYSLKCKLPDLWIDSENSHQVRYDFYQTVTKLYIESFFKPMREFCENYGMELIGHIDFEEYLTMQVNVQGDMTKVLGSLHYSGIDKIDIHNEKIAEKLVSSIGHLYKQPRILSETYALTGWGLDFTEMKRIADYQYVRGINLLSPHAFYYSIEGDRRWECPPSQFIQNPYWKYYHQFSDYITRLSYLLSIGTHVADIAVYYSMPSAYDLYKPQDMKDVIKIDQFLHNLTFTLLENQYDFDFVTDDALKNSIIEKDNIRIHDESYRLIILPFVSTLELTTLKKLKEFVNSGGILLILGTLPRKSVISNSNFESMMNEIMKKENTYYLDEYTLNKLYTYKFDIKKLELIYNQIVPSSQFNTLNPQLAIDLFETKYLENPIKDVILLKNDPSIKYLHRRIKHFDVYYFVNEDNNYRYHTIRIKAVGLIKEVDCVTGKTLDIHSRIVGDYTEFNVAFYSYGSKIFVVDHSQPTIEFDKVSYNERKEKQLKDWLLTIHHQSIYTSMLEWCSLGFEKYSGTGIYEKEIVVTREELNVKEVLLELETNDCVELWVNGQYTETKIWAPYTFSLKAHLVEGENQLKIIVTNTLFNQFNQLPKPSGLFAPVKLIFMI